MGEELKESKFYFKTSEDDEYKEIKSTGIQELQVNNIEFEETAYKEYQEKMMKLYDAFLKQQEEMMKTYDTFLKMEHNCKCAFDRETTRQLKKLVGIAPLSKKRTRKLLMAHGFDRDTAQMYADTMKARNMNKIKELIKIKEEYIDE